MKFNVKILLLCLIALVVIGIIATDSIQASYSPHTVETTIKNNWNKNYGYKSGNMTNGVNIVYDVYSKKYINGGYRITNKNFGNGSQPYLNFRGWAINFGYKRHTSSNHDTYIVAQNVANGTTKIYKTDHINISATEDVEYNNQGSGVWNECSASATKKDNIKDCNMRYDNVGFDAYLPLNDLFPDISKDYSYVLYLVKEVDGHIVYTPLILPFDFDKHTYQGGEVDLTSGVNANKLLMLGTNVLRRTQPRGSGVDSTYRYFSTGVTYSRIDSNEDQTAIWYGVNANGNKRWSSTAYWGFQGDQAKLTFKADDKPPIHVEHNLTGHAYKNGNDYWVQPNKKVTITLRQRDIDSGNDRGYIRLQGNGQDVRYYHNYSGAKTNFARVGADYANTSSLAINGANRTENTAQYGTIQWTVQPKTHAHSYNVHYYYRDLAMNTVGYADTTMNLRVDGEAPTHYAGSIGSQYTDGDTRWVKPNTTVNVRFRQYDAHSGNKYQYIRFVGNGVDVRSSHTFSESDNNNNRFMTNNSRIVIDSATREQNTSYGTVLWKATPKTHGHIYDVQYNYYDNVDNLSNYTTLGKLGVDGEAPVVQFRNNADSSNYTSQNWTNNTIDVRLKFSDAHSGYKRSRYAWTQSSSTPTESQWSSWSTKSNYLASQSKSGEWYLHVQAEDNLGNKITTKAGLYKINQPPVAKFSFTTPNYEGDPIALTNLSTDPEGHSMTALWTVKEPNGQTKTYTSWNLTISNAQSGDYQITLKVTDEIGAFDQVADKVNVIPLVITGKVFHTDYWKTIHEYFGNEEDEFYSGEMFMLEGYVTNYPIKKVEVDLMGINVNNGNITLNKELAYFSENVNIKTYNGSIYEEFMSLPDTKFKKDSTIKFIFKAEWRNGVVKQNVVNVRIIDDINAPFILHRTN